MIAQPDLPVDSAQDSSLSPLPPRHVAIIMDGNGRWAKQRGLPRVSGHQAGAQSVRMVTEACGELGVECLTVYAFSTENWKRPAHEVSALFGLLEHFLDAELPTLLANNVQLRAIGRLHELPVNAQEALSRAIEKTRTNTGLTLVLALNYSGRVELEDAIRAVCLEVKEGKLLPEQFTQEHLRKHLYTKDWPDPDLLIRTSGEMRLSNFLLWQLSYTELYVTPKLWPDFGKTDLLEAFQEFHRRQRRYGGI
ncbi:MAG: putative undecaprenyl diphosphate synthase [Verrucomicrobiota bacterium]